MLYALIGEDGPDSLAKRNSVRPEHLARVQKLLDEGRLVLAGPFPAIDATDPGPAGYTGSLIVAEFLSLEDARAWMAADPYVASGAYASIEVRPFKKVLP